MVVSRKKTDPKLVTISVNCKETQLRKSKYSLELKLQNHKLAWCNFVFCPVRLLFEEVFYYAITLSTCLQKYFKKRLTNTNRTYIKAISPKTEVIIVLFEVYWYS